MTEREGEIVLVLVGTIIMVLFVGAGWFFREELRTAQALQQQATQIILATQKLTERTNHMEDDISQLREKVNYSVDKSDVSFADIKNNLSLINAISQKNGKIAQDVYESVEKLRSSMPTTKNIKR